MTWRCKCLAGPVQNVQVAFSWNAWTESCALFLRFDCKSRSTHTLLFLRLLVADSWQKKLLHVCVRAWKIRFILDIKQIFPEDLFQPVHFTYRFDKPNACSVNMFGFLCFGFCISSIFYGEYLCNASAKWLVAMDHKHHTPKDMAIEHEFITQQIGSHRRHRKGLTQVLIFGSIAGRKKFVSLWFVGWGRLDFIARCATHPQPFTMSFGSWIWFSSLWLSLCRTHTHTLTLNLNLTL